MVNIDPNKFRPLGNRLLVKRYTLPEQSKGGIYVLGRDYPTLGTVIAIGKGDKVQAEFDNLHFFYGTNEVQWSIRPNFDTIGPDLLCLDFDDINLIIDSSGKAHAVGDRILIQPFSRHHDDFIIVKPEYLNRHQIGRVRSAGVEAKRYVSIDDQVLYDPSMVSEITLSDIDYHIISVD